MYGFINKLLGVVMCFIMIIIMLSNVMVSDQVQARRSIVAEVTNFVDEVTDTGSLNEKHVADLYLACSAYGPIVDVQVLRYGIVKKTAHPTNSIRQPAPDFAPTVRACAAEEGFPHWLYCVGGGYSRSRSIGRSFAGPAPAA